jgi:hypothetical protein
MINIRGTKLNAKRTSTQIFTPLGGRMNDKLKHLYLNMLVDQGKVISVTQKGEDYFVVIDIPTAEESVTWIHILSPKEEILTSPEKK